jgi:rare lipoprotein A
MRFWLAVTLFAVVLGGCTFGVPISDRGKQQPTAGEGVPATTPSKRGNPSSYVVFGKRYYVLDNSEGFVQRGVASWYGTKFHGRDTSSGEIYNMHAMTAAHKTLPIPVYVQVKNLDNGRSTVVRVNDRGPFIAGRIIDLSYAAAKKLGVDGPGTANVEISVLSQGESKPSSVVRSIPLNTDLEEDLPLFIQMGSFSSQLNANNMVQSLVAVNETAAQISHIQTDEGLLYRVRVGPLFDIDEANAVLSRLRGKGFQTAHIVVQDDAE